MISRLKVELEKIKTLRENLNGYRLSSHLNFRLKTYKLTCLRYKDQSLLARSLYRSGRWVNYVYVNYADDPKSQHT